MKRQPVEMEEEKENDVSWNYLEQWKRIAVTQFSISGKKLAIFLLKILIS